MDHGIVIYIISNLACFFAGFAIGVSVAVWKYVKRAREEQRGLQ